jgi:transcriptional regulator with XRE-family HTH domain
MRTGQPEIRPYHGPMAGRRPSKGKSLFGKRLAALREARGLTQAALAEKIGVVQQTIGYYESQSPSPTMDFAKQCADALEVAVDELLGESVPRRGKPGPRSLLDERIEALRELTLPKKQLALLIRMLDAFIDENATTK